MADYQAVGAMVAPIKQPDPMGQISSILGIRAQQQQLQSQAAVVQQQQIAAQEAQGVNDFFTNWSPGDHTGADGTTDIDSAHKSDAYKNLPGVARAAVDGKLIDIKKGQIANAQTMLGLTRDQLSFAGEQLGSIGTDPDVIAGNGNGVAKVQAALQRVQDLGGPGAARVAQAFSTITNGNLKPGDLPERLQAVQKMALTADRQLQVTAPGGAVMQTPQGAQVVNTNPYAPVPVGSKVGQPVTQGVAPGVVNLPGGNLGVTGSAGTVRPLTAAPGSAPAAAPPAPGKLAPLPAPGVNAQSGEITRYNANLEAARAHTQGIAAAANDIQNGVGSTQFRNAQIKDTLQKQLESKAPNITGPGSDTLHWLASHIPGATQYATDYDTLNHYLAQNSAALAKTMGVPSTNAGAETAAAGAGSTHQTPGALLEVTKTNDALNTALGEYNKGLSQVAPEKVQAFRNAWGQNFDVNVMRYDDALRTKDSKEISRLQSTLGADGMKALGQKRRILHSLSETGDMP